MEGYRYSVVQDLRSLDVTKTVGSGESEGGTKSQDSRVGTYHSYRSLEVGWNVRCLTSYGSR